MDRLLFGTLLGLDGSDLALSGAVALLAASRPPSRSAAPGRRSASTPTARPRSACPRAAPTCCCWRSWRVAAVAAIPAVGALLVAAVYVLPAAAARLLARSVRGLLGWALALALAEGVVGLYLAYWLDAPPGPADRRARRAVVRCAGARRGAAAGAGAVAA